MAYYFCFKTWGIQLTKTERSQEIMFQKDNMKQELQILQEIIMVEVMEVVALFG